MKKWVLNHDGYYRRVTNWLVYCTQIASKQLVGMLILVIAKKSIKSCFSDIQATSVGAGIMGLMVSMTPKTHNI